MIVLPNTPPTSTAVSISRGTTGWPAYALQSGLNSVLYASAERGGAWPKLIADGDFGAKSEEALVAFQRWAHLEPDGKAGPVTQAEIVSALDRRVHDMRAELPGGLLRGMALGESGNKLAAINAYTPPSGQKGVDCGVVQYRCYGPPFDITKLAQAFSPVRAMLHAADDFLGRVDFFFDQAGVRSHPRREEFAKRLAVLAHNWPAGARDIALDGWLSRPGDPAPWVHPATKFPDGVAVVSRIDWCQFYALGGPHGDGRITQFVTDWS